MICPPLNRKRSNRTHHDRNDRRNCYDCLGHSNIVDLFLTNTIKIRRRPDAPGPSHLGTGELTNPMREARPLHRMRLPEGERENSPG